MTNALKTPYGRALNAASQKKVLDYIQQTGRSLPASVVSVDGAIITVNFELLTDFTLPQVPVPLFGPVYIRYPIQPGDLGMVIAADAQIGAMCGLSSGAADLTNPSNLGALFFMPLGNANWDSVDANMLVLQGPDGVQIQDMQNKSVVNVNTDGISGSIGNSTFSFTTSQAQIALGSNNVTVTSSGVAINGTLTINGKAYLSHDHTGVQTGGGTSGPVGP